ncbi:MAG: AAA family ATPase [Ignavibacteria bacterium]|nr:AAA family ATPase [Ignavibacteria bacterium]
MKTFIGFEYNDYFEKLLVDDLTVWLLNKSVEAIYPINKIPGGILVDRILKMIDDSDISLWECTTVNPNVLFELGYSIGIGKPFFILFNKNYNPSFELPLLLKTQWGLWYHDRLELKNKLEDITSAEYKWKNSFYKRNEPISKDVLSSIDPNSITVIIDSTYNYDIEFKIINKCYKGSQINIIDIEQYANLYQLQNDILKASTVLCILSKIEDTDSPHYSNNKTVNALKLLAFGISQGLGKQSLIFQKGNKSFSDIESLARYYNNENEFKHKLSIWNKGVIDASFNGKYRSTRIKIPNLGKLIDRDNITNFLKKYLFSKHISLRAPSGYGKTAIILRLIHSLNYRTIWFTCDERLKETIEIVKDLLTELSNENVEIGKTLSSFIYSLNHDKISRTDIVNYFIMELHNVKQKTLIILDDIHYINNGDFIDFFEKLSETNLKNVSFIFISREELKNQSSQFKFTNCIILEKEEIEFKEQEVQKYFNEILSVNLSDEQLRLLSIKTEGWIASISLLQTIILQKGIDVIDSIIDNLKGNKKRIYDYFADIVYDNFDDLTQNYLKFIAIPFKLTAKDVSFTLKISVENSSKLLNSLEKQNSFLFNYENDPLIFKFHTLFREFLLKKLEEEDGIDKLTKCKNELSVYYYESKDYFESLIFGVEGENYDIAVKTVDSIGNVIINEGMGTFIYEFIQKIPETFYNDDYAFLIIKGRVEEFFKKRLIALQTYYKAKAILSSRPDNKREYNLVNFFILQLEIHQTNDKSFIPDSLVEIVIESEKEKDIELYSYAFGLYSQIKRISLLIRPNPDKKIHQIEHEKFIEEIDKAIYKLRDANLNSKDLYIAQLLVDKAMISHSLSWYSGMELLTMERLSSGFGVQISVTEKNRIQQLYSTYFKQEQACFEMAMKIAVEMNNLQLKANILVARSLAYDSKNNFLAFSYGYVDEDLVNVSLNDLNEALSIYLDHKNMPSIASVYNNLAQTYLLKNDKESSVKYAKLANQVANEFGYPEIIKSSTDILNTPTITETIENSKRQINEEMEKGISKENEDKIIENWIGMLGDISDNEKTKRIQIFKQQNENIRLQKLLIKSWCKFIDVFHTNLPITKHDDTGISMIKSYLNRDEIAVKAHRLSRTLGVDFSEPLAIFIYCHKLGTHSNKLYLDTEQASNQFIAELCSNCQFREL